MKHVLLVSAIAMMSLNAHAATSACKKLALKAVDVDITSKVDDDCYSQYVQEAKNNPNLLFIGIGCNHVGSFQYAVNTAPKGRSCRILAIQSKEASR